MLQIIFYLLVIGLLLYLLNLAPIDATIKTIIHAVVIVLVIIWLLGMFHSVPVIHLR